jgi:hypothetical protein
MSQPVVLSSLITGSSPNITLGLSASTEVVDNKLRWKFWFAHSASASCRATTHISTRI